MSAIVLTDQNFEEEVLKASVSVLVDFWAPWCGPCKTMMPIMEELEKEYTEKGVRIGKMNVDENPTTPSQYQVMSIPTFILFRNGKIAYQTVGVQTKTFLKQIIDKNL